MRIMSLNEMLDNLRHEARLSGNPSHGTHLRDRYIALLRRVQEGIYDEFDWPALRIDRTVELGPGARYAAYPEDLAFETINVAHVKMEGDTEWVPLIYGVGVDQLNSSNSDQDERADRVRRWTQHLPLGSENVTQNMFEVWPIPNKPATVRFTGQHKLNPLSDPDTDYSTVDGMAVVLHAAAEILAGNKAEDANLKLQKALARVAQSRTQQSAPDNRSWGMHPGASSAATGQRFRHE